MITLADEIRHNNPYRALIDVNSIRAIHIVEDITERDNIPQDKRKAGPKGSVAFVNGTVYQYTNISINNTDWVDSDNWQQIIGKNESVSSVYDYIEFTTTENNPPYKEGYFFYDNVKKALAYYNDIEGVEVNTGQELIFRVYNDTGSIITNGSVVYPNGSTVGLADAKYKDKSRLVAVATHDIPNESFGWVTKIGQVGGLDTSSYNLGDILRLQSNGTFSTDTQVDGAYDIIIGVVDVVHATEGVITVDIVGTELTAEVVDTNGLPTSQKDNTTLTINDGTRTLSIAAISGTEFHYYQTGKKYEQTSQQDVVFTDQEGDHWFYFDEMIFTVLYNPTNEQKEDIILNKAFIATIYWDAANKTHIFDIFDERHGISMSPYSHLYNHLTRGAQYGNGIGLGNIITDASGALATHAQFSVASGIFFDEDIKHIVNTLAVGTTIPVLYLQGATPTLREGSTTNFAVLHAPAGRLYYNQFTGGSWQLTEVANNDYVLYHIFAINGVNKQIVSIVGQNDYATAAAARLGAAEEVGSILTLFDREETIAIGTIIFQTSTTYANSVKARIISYDVDNDYLDWRFSENPKGASPTSHLNLTDTTEPDLHPIASITNLQTTLDATAEKIVTPTNVKQLALLNINSNGQYKTTNKYYVRNQQEFTAVFEDSSDPVKYIECIGEIDFPVSPTIGSSETYIGGVKMTASNGVNPQNNSHFQALVYFRNTLSIGGSTITPNNNNEWYIINLYFKNIVSSSSNVEVILGGASIGTAHIYYNEVSENVKLLGTAIKNEWDKVSDTDKETWYNTSNTDCKLVKGIRYGNRFSLEVEFTSRDQVTDDTVNLFPSTWADSVRASFDKTEIMCKSTDPTAVTPTVTIAPYFDSVAGLINIDLDGVIAGVALYEGTIHRNDQGDGSTAYKENGKVLPQANAVIFTVNQDSGNTDGLVFKTTITGTLTNFYQ